MRRSSVSSGCCAPSLSTRRLTQRLAEARRNRQLATWSEQADRAAAEGRWSDAVIQLENIRSLDANYPDLTRRLQVATAKRRAADLQSDIRTLAAAGQPAAASAAGQELARLDPARADPDGLVGPGPDVSWPRNDGTNWPSCRPGRVRPRPPVGWMRPWTR